MTLNDFGWFAAGAAFGAFAGLVALAREQGARARQVRELVAAYEARVAEILARLR